MKVLNIIHRYYPAIGGSESWCRNLCRFLANSGVVTKVATMNMYNMEESFGGALPEQAYFKLGKMDEDEGVLIRRYDLSKLWSNAFGAKLVRFLLNKMNLRKTQIGDIFRTSPQSFEMYRGLIYEIKGVDIVILHTLPFFHNLVGFLIAKIYRKNIFMIPYFHPGHIHYERKIFFQIMNHCDAVIALTEYEKAHFIKRDVAAEKIFVFGCSIDEKEPLDSTELERFKLNLFGKYKIDEKSKRIIFLGRKEIYKGIDLLIKAAQEIADEEAWELCLFLVGPDTQEFLDLFPDFSNNNMVTTGKLKVINWGRVLEQEKNYLLEFSDLLILPSKFESFGIVFLEAWKYKKPVIGPNKGASFEVIAGAGLCAEYGSVSDLKEKIKLILNDEKLAQKLGEAGKNKLYEKYNIEKIGNSFINICGNLKRYKKRVLLVSQLFPPYFLGGAEIAAYEQNRLLKKMGFEIKVFAGKNDGSKKQYAIKREKNEFQITRINLHPIDFCHQDGLILEKKELLDSFRQQLYVFAPDVVHFHGIYGFSLKMIEECFKMHIPMVMTLHDYWGICINNILVTHHNLLCDGKDSGCLYCKDKVYQIDGKETSISQRNDLIMSYLNMVDLLISPSQYLLKKFIDRGILKNKTRLIKYGIDISRFKDIKKSKSDKIRFVFIGQIITHKGIENLIESVAALNDEERKRISLLLIGTGEKMFVEYCQKLTVKLKLTDCIRFVGEIRNTEVSKAYKNIDAIIVPSIWPENSPVTILESLAAGTPVLASDIGGIPELIEDGVEGYLHKYDEPLALAQNIRKVIENPGELTRMRQACLMKAGENDLIDQVKKIADDYRRIM